MDAEERCANAEEYCQAERLLLNRPQRDSVPDDFCPLKAGKPVQHNSCLFNLSPELDDTGKLIQVLLQHFKPSASHLVSSHTKLYVYMNSQKNSWIHITEEKNNIFCFILLFCMCKVHVDGRKFNINS